MYSWGVYFCNKPLLLLCGYTRDIFRPLSLSFAVSNLFGVFTSYRTRQILNYPSVCLSTVMPLNIFHSVISPAVTTTADLLLMNQTRLGTQLFTHPGQNLGSSFGHPIVELFRSLDWVNNWVPIWVTKQGGPTHLSELA